MKQVKKEYKITLFQFKGFDFEDYYSLYCEEQEPWSEKDISFFGLGDEYSHPKQYSKNKNLVLWKVMFLQNAIIRSWKNTFKGYISVNAAILQKVIGRDYLIHLRLLYKLGFIAYKDDRRDYEIGRYSTRFVVRAEYVATTTTNAKVKKYIDRLNDEYKKKKQKDREDLIAHFGKDFYYDYNKSLNLVHIKDKEGYNKAVASLISNSPKDEGQYKSYKDRLEKKEAITMDGTAHRIYHTVAEMKSELRRYLNLAYSIDCSNCHPVLLLEPIFNAYDIKPEESYHICKFVSLLNLERIKEELKYNKYDFYSALRKIDLKEVEKYVANYIIEPFWTVSTVNNIAEYVAQVVYDTYTHNNITNNIYIKPLCSLSIYDDKNKIKELRNSLLFLRHFSEFPRDLVDYIRVVCTGQIWDYFAREFNLSRGEVKDAMFNEVYYGKSQAIRHKQEYAEKFRKMFPKVMNYILEWRKPQNRKKVFNLLWSKHVFHDAEGGLSVYLMSVEVDIFTSVLKKIYAKGYHAINVHDSIYALEQDNMPAYQDIQALLEEQFRKHGLYATLKTKINNSPKAVILDLDSLLSLNNLAPFYPRGYQPRSKEYQEAWQRLMAEVKNCKLFDGVQGVIDYYIKNKHKCCIISNETKTITNKCKQAFRIPIIRNGIVSKYGEPTLKRRIKHAILEVGEEPSNIVLFSNKPLAVKYAQECGCKAYACAWAMEDWVKSKNKNLPYITKPIEMQALSINFI